METYPAKLLVVDDEIHILHVVALKLRNAGFEVVTARNGRDAWELAQLELPDLIITDYQMPYLTGLELAEQLKQNPATSDIPTILLTAHGFNLDKDLMHRLGIVACINKPFGPRDLLRLVQDVLQPAMAC